MKINIQLKIFNCKQKEFLNQYCRDMQSFLKYSELQRFGEIYRAVLKSLCKSLQISANLCKILINV